MIFKKVMILESQEVLMARVKSAARLNTRQRHAFNQYTSFQCYKMKINEIGKYFNEYKKCLWTGREKKR